MLAQLTTGEWEELVKRAVKEWYDSAALERHPLTALRAAAERAEGSAYAGDPYRRAKALRDVLREAVAALGVEGEPPPERPDDPRWMERRWRPWAILTLARKEPPGEVAARLGLALGGQYYRDQARAYDMLAERLRLQEGSPVDAASSAALAYPSGAVRLDDPFYIPRDVDAELAGALARPGETITIRGPRQVGKTSLLIRGIREAQRRFGARVVYFDLQGVGGLGGAGGLGGQGDVGDDLDAFLLRLADWFADELGIDPAAVETAWAGRLPAQRKLTKFIEQHVLNGEGGPVLLAMDEIDRLQLTPFHSDFFGLVRSWHNRRAGSPQWNNLTTLMAVSTEPYLLIDDLNQSPFNVGHVLNLRDFDAAQVGALNRLYGAPLGASELAGLLALLGGHPYLTRVALYTLATGRAGWPALAAAAASDQGPFHQHLQWQYRLLIRDPRLREAMREVVLTNRCDDAAAGFRLMKAGLVVKREDAYVCRCELYRLYFAARL
jgi:hypothetical protein